MFLHTGFKQTRFGLSSPHQCCVLGQGGVVVKGSVVGVGGIGGSVVEIGFCLSLAVGSSMSGTNYSLSLTNYLYYSTLLSLTRRGSNDVGPAATVFVSILEAIA